DKLYGLVRARRSIGAVKHHLARFHMHLLLCSYIRISCRASNLRPAFQIKLHFAAAGDASALFFVLAALRMNRVVPLSLLSEDGDLHVFQQTRSEEHTSELQS